MTTLDLNQDPANPVEDIASTEDDSNGVTEGIDWESAENPYKNKFSGEQSRSSRLQSALDEERATRSSTSEMLERLENIEDMVAGVGDRVVSRASVSSEDIFDDDDSTDSSEDSTGSFRDGIRESREARVVRDRDLQANKVYSRMNEGWQDGMNMTDPEMVEVSRLYNGALTDPAKRGDLNTALVMFNSYASKLEATRSLADPPPSTSTEVDDKSGDDAGGSNNANDPAANDDEPDPQPTARQKNRDAGADQGQQGAGGATPRDISNLTPMDKFKLHEAGETPNTF